MKVKTDCRFFRGDMPCRPHKTDRVHCEGCRFYDAITKKILIIKLGAIGDVIRTTPLLRKLKEIYPGAQIHWLTQSPQILPAQWIDAVYSFRPEHIEILKQIDFDILYNLDKDHEACALCNRIRSEEKHGFILKYGTCHPANAAAENKWLTGLFDDLNQKNQKSYPQEIFEICGFDFQGEEYILDLPEKRSWNLPDGNPVVGLNTGCGARWKSRLWPDDHWIALAKSLKEAGYTVLFLGGEQEHQKNMSMAKLSGTHYLGHFSLPVFISLMNQCDIVVTAVTMALHIALGLKKKVVLFNNIFNRHEFEMYGRGIIIEPPNTCLGCFMGDCEKACMELIEPVKVLNAVKQI